MKFYFDILYFSPRKICNFITNINYNLNDIYMFLVFDNLKYCDNQIIYQYHLHQYFLS